MLKAKRELDLLNLPDEERSAYERYQDDLHYQASMVHSSYHDGKYEGKLEEKIAITNKLLNANIPIEQITKFTGLSVEEIKQLVGK